MSQLATSRVLVQFPISGPVSAGNLTQYPVEVALIADNGAEPADGDYHAGSWIDGEAALLVGPAGGGFPAGVIYPAGDYMAFGRVTAGVERPVVKSGRWKIGM
jgi:hypothetical protein